MRHFLSIMIADEYIASNNPQKAQVLLQKSLSIYEKENWWPLVDDLKRKLASIKDMLPQSSNESPES